MKEFELLGKHPEEKSKYKGEYIAVVGERIASHGKDPKVVIKEAKKLSSKPLIAKVPKGELVIV